MAHQQTNLTGPGPLLTLEEAYWRVMSKITEVEDFLQWHTTVGSITYGQRIKAGELHRTLTNRTMYLQLVLHSEPDKATFYNTRDWVEIIEEENMTKLEAINNILNPKTSPRWYQKETYVDLQLRRKQINDPTLDRVKQTTVYNNNQETLREVISPYPTQTQCLPLETCGNQTRTLIQSIESTQQTPQHALRARCVRYLEVVTLFHAWWICRPLFSFLIHHQGHIPNVEAKITLGCRTRENANNEWRRRHHYPLRRNVWTNGRRQKKPHRKSKWQTR